MEWVAPRIDDLLANVGKFLTAAINWATDVAGPAFREKAKEWGGILINWVGEDALPYIVNRLNRFSDAVFGWFRDTALPTSIDWLKKMANAFLDWVTDTAAPNIVSRLTQWRDKITTWLRDTAIPNAKDWLKRMGNAFLDWVAEDALPYIGTKLNDFSGAIANWFLKTGIPVAKTWLTDMGKRFVNWLDDVLVPGPGGLSEKLGQFKETLRSGVNGAIRAIISPLQTGLNAVGKFVNGFGNAINKVGEFLGVKNLVPTWTVPTIPVPQYAKGTSYHRGGAAIVGEEGPELVHLPAGSRVLTAAQTRRKMGGAAQPDTVEGYGKPWPNGVVPYVIRPDYRRPDIAHQAMRRWAAATNASFVPRTTQHSYIRFVNSKGNSAHVGDQPNMGAQHVNLFNSENAGITIHEVGHALGLNHEHQRHDRDRYINVHPENMDPKFRWAIMDKIWNDYGPYDYKSIMHYSHDAFSINGRPTITSKNGQSFGQRSYISPGDVMSVRKIYPNPTPADTGSHGTIPPPPPPPPGKGSDGMLARGAKALLERLLRPLFDNLRIPGVIGTLARSGGNALLGWAVDWIGRMATGGDGGGGGGGGGVPGGGMPLNAISGAGLYNPGDPTFYGRPHRGWDLFSRSNDRRVFAPMGGIVDSLNRIGVTISKGNVRDLLWHIIDWASGIRPGEQVTTGQYLGRYAQVGTSNTPHLHWERAIDGILRSDRSAYGLPADIDRRRRGGPVQAGRIYEINEPN